MTELVRYGSKSEHDGPHLRDGKAARAWFHEREFTCCEACGWMPLWHPRVTGPALLGMMAFHHILPRKAGGPNRQGNLALLCCNCHRLAHFLWPMRRAANGRKYYRGPKGRTEFIGTMRAVLRNPQEWYADDENRRRFPATNYTGSVRIIDDSWEKRLEKRSHEPAHG